MRGELRQKFMSDLDELIGDCDREGAVSEFVSDFINDIEAAFNDIKADLDDDTLKQLDGVSSAYDKAEDYADKLY
jgi:hypothetical protein